MSDHEKLSQDKAGTTLSCRVADFLCCVVLVYRLQQKNPLTRLEEGALRSVMASRHDALWKCGKLSAK